MLAVDVGEWHQYRKDYVGLKNKILWFSYEEEEVESDEQKEQEAKDLIL